MAGPKQIGTPSIESMLGLDPAMDGGAEMLGGKDNEGGGFDVDASRLKKALDAGDGDTVHSIIKGIVLKCLDEEKAGGYEEADDFDDDEG